MRNIVFYNASKIMKKVGILNIQGENFLGRNYGVSGRVGLPGESFMGGNYPGGSFPKGNCPRSIRKN